MSEQQTLLKIIRYIGDIDETFAYNAQLQTYLEWYSKDKVESVTSYISELEQSNLELQAENQRMEEAYNKYAWHKKDCMLFSIAEHPHCTCGFDKALAATPQKGQENE